MVNYCMENIKENILHLEARKKELKKIQIEISERREAFKIELEEQRKKFEESLTDLKETENGLLDEFRLAREDKVTVNLGELVCELASLKGLNPLNIGISIETDVAYYGKYRPKKIAEILNNRDNQIHGKPQWQVMLYTNTMKKPQIDEDDFEYMFKFDLNLDELQTDGKTLLEHCSTAWGYDDLQGLCTTKLVIDKYIGSLACNISMSDLISSENTVYGKDRWLLAQAIQNCVERQNSQNQPSVKSISKKLKLNK